MQYKAPDNSIHFIEPEYAHLLPAGCVPITDEEAQALRPKPPEPTVQDQLNALDETYKLTQRNLRDFILLVTEAMKTGDPIDLSVLPGVQVVAAVEAEAQALREQL